MKKTVSGSTTLYFYDNEGKLLEEYDPSTGTGKDYIWLPMTHQPLARIDFSLTDTDNGNVLRDTKSGADVHLDWTLDGTSGPFVVERSTSFSFSNPEFLGLAQSEKTFDDGVLTNGTNYAYRIFRRTLTDTLYLYHDDHLRTPLAMTNTSGNFVWQVEQYPFGGIYAMPVSTVQNNLRFTGQYFDGETGLAQNWFRDYNNRTGRYWEPDPLSIDGFMITGLYLYAMNCPSNQNDIKGLQASKSQGDHCHWRKTGPLSATFDCKKTEPLAFVGCKPPSKLLFWDSIKINPYYNGKYYDLYQKWSDHFAKLCMAEDGTPLCAPVGITYGGSGGFCTCCKDPCRKGKNGK